MAPTATDRFAASARELGIEPRIEKFPRDTRTAVQAAEALGCELGQIVKSLVFAAQDRVVLVLTSGTNRVDQAKAAAAFGVDLLDRADPEVARTAAGFAIGGIPPFGHPTPIEAIIDPDLLTWDEIWAAAGAPDAVFAIEPDRLVELAAARVVDIAET